MGIAVGCVAGAMGNSYMKSNKKGLKKNVGRARATWAIWWTT